EKRVVVLETENHSSDPSFESQRKYPQHISPRKLASDVLKELGRPVRFDHSRLPLLVPSRRVQLNQCVYRFAVGFDAYLEFKRASRFSLLPIASHVPPQVLRARLPILLELCRQGNYVASSIIDNLGCKALQWRLEAQILPVTDVPS